MGPRGSTRPLEICIWKTSQINHERPERKVSCLTTWKYRMEVVQLRSEFDPIYVKGGSTVQWTNTYWIAAHLFSTIKTSIQPWNDQNRARIDNNNLDFDKQNFTCKNVYHSVKLQNSVDLCRIQKIQNGNGFQISLTEICTNVQCNMGEFCWILTFFADYAFHRIFYSIIPFGFVHFLFHISFNYSWISLSNQTNPPCNMSPAQTIHIHISFWKRFN